MLFICRPQNAICMHANMQPNKFSPCQIATSQPTFYTPEKTTQNSSAQKFIFKLLKPQIKQTSVLQELHPPPPPLFFLAFFLLVFFLGRSLSQYTKIPKNIKNDISITWNLVQEKILHEEIIAYVELRMACQIAPFVYFVIMHLFVHLLFFSSISNSLSNT